MVKSLSWKDLAAVNKVYEEKWENDDLTEAHENIAKEVFYEVDLRAKVVEINQMYFVDVQHIDEFGHQYDEGRIERKRVEEIKGRVHLKVKRLRSKQLGFLLDAIPETDEVKE